MAPPVRLHDYRVLVRALRSGSAAHQARAVVREVLEAAGVDAERAGDAEIAVAELAANAETHADEPYELRIVTVDGEPAWCEVADGDEDLAGITAILDELRSTDPIALWFQGGGECLWDGGVRGVRESGRGLLMVHQLSEGRCAAYSTKIRATGVPGKAVGFVLPTGVGPRRPASPPPAAELRGLPQQTGAGVGPRSPASWPGPAVSPPSCRSAEPLSPTGAASRG